MLLRTLGCFKTLFPSKPLTLPAVIYIYIYVLMILNMWQNCRKGASTADFVKYYGFSVFKHNLKNTFFFLPISVWELLSLKIVALYLQELHVISLQLFQLAVKTFWLCQKFHTVSECFWHSLGLKVVCREWTDQFRKRSKWVMCVIIYWITLEWKL